MTDTNSPRKSPAGQSTHVRSSGVAARVAAPPEGPAADLTLELLQERLGYTFKDTGLLEEALTHMSYANENRHVESNERFEFLGDAILGAAVGHLLMERYPTEREGQLTRYKSLLVSEHGLFEVGRSIDLAPHLRLGRGETKSGGRDKPSLIANAVEAVVAAVFLDGGFVAARELVERLVGPRMGVLPPVERAADYKTRFQEYVQTHFRTVPTYRVTAMEGPDHDRRFTVESWVGSELVGVGRADSKRRAEQLAARDGLRRIRDSHGVIPEFDSTDLPPQEF